MHEEMVPLPVCIARIAREDPARQFLDDIGGAASSYGEFYHQALRWAGFWRKIGLSEGDRALTMLHPSTAWFAAWMGLGLIKAIDAGLNTEFKGPMLRYAIERSGAVAIVISADLQDRLTPEIIAGTALTHVIVCGGPPTLNLPGVAVLAAETELGAPVDPGTLPALDMADVAALIMTSGTTGPSKFVACPWGVIKGGSLTWPIDEMDSRDTLYCMVPVFHGAARMMIWSAVSLGGRCVFRASFSRTAFWRDIETYRCTFGFLPAAALPWLLAQPPADNDRENAMRFIFTVPVTPQVQRFGERFGIRMITGYGGTETGTIVLGDYDPAKPGSCGRLRAGFPHFEMKLVDESGHEVPAGQFGEIVVRTSHPAGIFKEYFGDREATDRAWRDGWFHTGDALRIDADGAFHFGDRIKDALRRRGENISSLEVEAIVNTLPAMVECAAVAVLDDGGEQEMKLVAVLDPAADMTAEALHAHLREMLPRFMVPRYLELAAALPRTEATGRVMKAKLREAGLSPATWDSEAHRAETARFVRP